MLSILSMPDILNVKGSRFSASHGWLPRVHDVDVIWNRTPLKKKPMFSLELPYLCKPTVSFIRPYRAACHPRPPIPSLETHSLKRSNSVSAVVPNSSVAVKTRVPSPMFIPPGLRIRYLTAVGVILFSHPTPLFFTPLIRNHVKAVSYPPLIPRDT